MGTADTWGVPRLGLRSQSQGQEASEELTGDPAGPLLLPGFLEGGPPGLLGSDST